MKPAAFDYVRPNSLDEVLAILVANAGEAKIIAGGQSLMPLLNFRMLRPAILVDINAVEELSKIHEAESGLRIGAMTRHHTLETSELIRRRFPVVTEAMRHVAHLAIRNRGTIGGSLSHADPAAELPMMAMLLDGRIHTRSGSEKRTHAARDFFVAPLTSALEDTEIVTEIEVDNLPAGAGWAFEEFAQRAGDFAIAAVAATVVLKGKTVSEIRIALMGVDATPVRMWDIEKQIVGETLTDQLVEKAALLASTTVEPNTDLKASAAYRRHLVAALTERALFTARRRAEAGAQ